MIVDPARLDRLIERKGWQRTLDREGWLRLADLLHQAFGNQLCFRYCRIDQQEPPAKQSRQGFPERSYHGPGGRVLDELDYLYVVDFFFQPGETMEWVQAHLDAESCPWEPIWGFDDEGEKVVEGLRVFGFRKG